MWVASTFAIQSIIRDANLINCRQAARKLPLVGHTTFVDRNPVFARLLWHSSAEDFMSDQSKTAWQAGGPLAASIRRIRPLDWALASAACGIAVFFIVLALLWRDWFGLAAPSGSIGSHVQGCLAWIIHSLSPSLLAQAASDYQTRVGAMRASGELFGAQARVAIALFAATVPAVVLAFRYLRPKDGLIHLRGARRHTGAGAERALKKALAARAARRPDHEIAPGVAYPADLWTRHIFLAGGTGSGKSTALKPIIEKIIRADEKMILFDPKGEFTKAFPEPCLIAPWDSRSHSWDIGKDMRNIGDMRRFAGALVKEGQDPMWANAARQLLVGFLLYLRDTRGTLWGWRELADMLATSQEHLLPLMRRYNPEAVRAVERASVTTQGILINLSAFCAPIYDLAAAWGDIAEEKRVSFVEWVMCEGPRHRQIILQGHGSYPDITKGYVESVFGVISAIVNSVEMDDDPNRKLWIVADELPQMGKVPIRQLFEVGRSRGVRCLAACQDLSQLEAIHGKEAIRSLISMSGALMIGQTGQGDTAEALAKSMGSREVERRNESASYGGAASGPNSNSVSFARDELQLYKPSELGSRLGYDAERGGVTMALALEGNVYELFYSLYRSQSKRVAHMPAPWTLGAAPVDTRLGEAGADLIEPVRDAAVFDRDIDELLARAGQMSTNNLARGVDAASQAGASFAAPFELGEEWKEEYSDLFNLDEPADEGGSAKPQPESALA